jgi:hypothetical protein
MSRVVGGYHDSVPAHHGKPAAKNETKKVDKPADAKAMICGLSLENGLCGND